MEQAQLNSGLTLVLESEKEEEGDDAFVDNLVGGLTSAFGLTGREKVKFCGGELSKLKESGKWKNYKGKKYNYFEREFCVEVFSGRTYEAFSNILKAYGLFDFFVTNGHFEEDRCPFHTSQYEKIWILKNNSEKYGLWKFCLDYIDANNIEIKDLTRDEIGEILYEKYPSYAKNKKPSKSNQKKQKPNNPFKHSGELTIDSIIKEIISQLSPDAKKLITTNKELFLGALSNIINLWKDI